MFSGPKVWFPAKEYWGAIAASCGGDKELKDIILSEHAGVGVVAALIATISVSCLLLTPASYNPVSIIHASM